MKKVKIKVPLMALSIFRNLNLGKLHKMQCTHVVPTQKVIY